MALALEGQIMLLQQRIDHADTPTRKITANYLMLGTQELMEKTMKAYEIAIEKEAANG